MPLRSEAARSERALHHGMLGKYYQVVEKEVSFRLFKNIRMQGARNPEERGVPCRTPQ